jgi:hypothetical protein
MPSGPAQPPVLLPPPGTGPQLPAGPPPGLSPFFGDDPAASGGNAFSDGEPVPQEATRWELGIEYLLWWTKSERFPPLLTVGNFADAVPAALGEPGTAELFGGKVMQNAASGGRFSLTYWAIDPQVVCVDANFFILEQRSVLRHATGDGGPFTPVLAKPFFNPNLNIEDADPIAVPDAMSGAVDIAFTTRFMGGEANVRWYQCVSQDYCFRIGFLGGFRFLGLDEKLIMQSTSTELPAGTGRSFYFSDNFTTYNRFYGGQAGADIEFRWDRLSLHVLGKLAVGNNQETVQINGNTVITQIDGTLATSNTQGLFAQPTNVGTYKQSKFTYVPGLDVNLSWTVNEHIRFAVGYTFIDWVKAARPGGQIDRSVSIQAIGAPALLGVARPTFSFHESDFWAQGVNLSLGISF